jgi:hypothetical protein
MVKIAHHHIFPGFGTNKQFTPAVARTLVQQYLGLAMMARVIVPKTVLILRYGNARAEKTLAVESSDRLFCRSVRHDGDYGVIFAMQGLAILLADQRNIVYPAVASRNLPLDNRPDKSFNHSIAGIGRDILQNNNHVIFKIVSMEYTF